MNDEIICECGHAVTEHTYSTDFNGCDRKGCNCTRLVPAIVANALRARVEAAERERDELVVMLDTWRKEAKGSYCQTYNKGKAEGLEAAANELEAFIAVKIYEEAAEEYAALRAREVCTGCGTKKIDAILAVINGAAACCPDCTTLTVDERNVIREALRARVEAAEANAEKWRGLLIDLVTPDGFYHEECPKCEQTGTHADDCELAAALAAKGAG